MVHLVCRLYPGLSPLDVAEAPTWLLRHIELLRAAGVING